MLQLLLTWRVVLQSSQAAEAAAAEGTTPGAGAAHSLRELQLGQFINSCHIAKIDCNDLYFLLPFTLYFAPYPLRVHFLIPLPLRLLLPALCPRFHLVNTFTIISFHCLFSLQVPGILCCCCCCYAFVSFRLLLFLSFASFASLVSLSLSELDWLQRLPGPGTREGRREGSANLLWSTQYNVLRL